MHTSSSLSICSPRLSFLKLNLSYSSVLHPCKKNELCQDLQPHHSSFSAQRSSSLLHPPLSSLHHPGGNTRASTTKDSLPLSGTTPL